MLTAVADPPSTSRVTSAGVGTDSSATNGTSSLPTSQRRPSTSSAGHSSSANDRPRSAISFMAHSDSAAVQPLLPSTYSSTSSPKRSRSARTTAVSRDTGRRPTLTLKVEMPYSSRILSASATIVAGSSNPSMWHTRMWSENPPKSSLTCRPRVRPHASQMAMSMADLAVGLPTVRARRAFTTSRSVNFRPTTCGANTWEITAMMPAWVSPYVNGRGGASATPTIPWSVRTRTSTCSATCTSPDANRNDLA